MFFAIVSDTPGMLIAQQVVEDTEEKISFLVQEFPADENLHYYTYEVAEVDPEAVLQRANISEIYAQQIEESGQHWWTPPEVTPKQILDDLQEPIQREMATTHEGASPSGICLCSGRAGVVFICETWALGDISDSGVRLPVNLRGS